MTTPTATGGPAPVDHRRLARAGGLALGGFVVSAILQLGLVLVVTHGLGRTEAGVVLEAVAIFSLVSAWVGFGADTGLVRWLSALLATHRTWQLRPVIVTALVPVVIVATLAGAVLWVIAPWLSTLVFNESQTPATTEALRLLALFLPFGTVAGIAAAGSRGLSRIVPYVAIVNVGIPGARIVAVALAVVFAGSLTSVLVAWSMPLVVAALVAVAILWAAAGRIAAGDHAEPEAGRAPGLRREFWSFAAPRGLATICGQTISWLDVVLVGAFSSPRNAAVYAAASRIAILGAYALQAAGMVISPEFSRHHTLRDWEGLGALYRQATVWTMMLGWPFYVSVVAFPAVLMRVFGHDYTNGATALTIIGAAQLVNLATGNITFVLLMTGRSRLNLLNATLACTVNVALNLLLIPRYGITGAALAWAATIVGVNMLELGEAWRAIRLRPFSRRYAGAAAAVLVCWGAAAAVVRLAAGESVAAFAAYLVIGALGYVVVLARSPETAGVRTLLAVGLKPNDA